MPRYIDADALKDVIQQHDYPLADKLNSIDNGMFTPGIFHAIDQMPTISPDEVRGVGKWKKTDAFPHRVYCLNCFKTIVPNEEYAFWCEGIMPRNYCPNCGARMGGVQDALS